MTKPFMWIIHGHHHQEYACSIHGEHAQKQVHAVEQRSFTLTPDIGPCAFHTQRRTPRTAERAGCRRT